MRYFFSSPNTESHMQTWNFLFPPSLKTVPESWNEFHKYCCKYNVVITTL